MRMVVRRNFYEGVETSALNVVIPDDPHAWVEPKTVRLTESVEHIIYRCAHCDAILVCKWTTTPTHAKNEPKIYEDPKEYEYELMAEAL